MWPAALATRAGQGAAGRRAAARPAGRCATTACPSRRSRRRCGTSTARPVRRRGHHLPAPLRAGGRHPAEPGAEDVAAKLADKLAARHAEHLVSADGTTTDELLARALLARGWTVATGESCTGGMLASRLVDRRGVVRVRARRGRRLLQRGEDRPARRARRADRGARRGVPGGRAGARGRRTGRARRRRRVGITGVAGPDGGTPDKPVGYVCLCATTASGAVRRPRLAAPRQPRRRARPLDRRGHAPAAAGRRPRP